MRGLIHEEDQDAKRTQRALRGPVAPAADIDGRDSGGDRIAASDVDSPLLRRSARRFQPLVVVFLAAATGIATDRFFAPPMPAWLIAVGVTLAIWLALVLVKCDRSASLVLLASVVMAGGAWHHARWSLFSRSDIGWRLTERSQPLGVEAIVVGIPRLHPAPRPNPLATREMGDRVSVDLIVERIKTPGGWDPASGNVRLTIDGSRLDVEPGDRVRVFAMASRPETPKNPGQRDFAAMHRSERRLAVLRAGSADAVRIVERRARWTPIDALQRLRSRANGQLWRYLDRPQAGLAAAVLLGVREQIGRDRADEYLESGTVHLLAISGLHVGILAAGFFLAARFNMHVRRRTWMTAAALVVIYAVLTDSRPPVVRAAVLIVVMCVGRTIGRPASTFNSLAAAALGVLAVSPDSLFQTGAQLSFLAVATLALSGPLFVRRPSSDPLDRLLAAKRSWWIRAPRAFAWWAWRLWLTSLVVWFVAIPIVAHQFHLISWVAIVANPMVWLPITVALYSGMAVLLTGAWAPPLAIVFGRVCNAALGTLEACVAYSAGIPGGFTWTAGPNGYWVSATYVLLAAAVMNRDRVQVRRRWLVALLVAWLGLGAATSLPALRFARRSLGEPRLTATFLSVGHGGCVILELPDGRVLMYDCGRLGWPDGGVRDVSGALWSAGIERLDGVILSHADADHYNLLPGLADRFRIGRVYVSPYMFDAPNEALEALSAAMRRAEIPVDVVSAQTAWWDDAGVRIDLLHPASPAPGDSPRWNNDNSNSLVAVVEFQGRRLLLPGDLEDAGMDGLLERPALDVDVAMAPHHGSVHSRPAGFAEWSTPEFVVISADQPTSPALQQAYDQRGAVTLNTSEHGAIRATIRRGELRIDRWNSAAAGWKSVPSKAAE